MKTQGSHIYIIDPGASGGPAVLEIECPNALNGISAKADQLDTTCLGDAARTFVSGLVNPSPFTLGLNFEPGSDSHQRLLALWKAGTKFEMALGYSDGTTTPEIGSDGLFDLPATRSWLVFHDAYVSDFPQDFAINSLVTANVEFQPSGFYDVIPKTP